MLSIYKQEKYRQEQLSKLKAEEDAKVRFNDCTKHYENQIRTMRVNHEQVNAPQLLIHAIGLHCA